MTQHNSTDVLPIEKIIAVLSYLTMGIAGLIWIIIAYFLKKKLRYFLMYNITQSMIISIFLALISVVMSILALIPFINAIAAFINFIFSVKVLTLPFLRLSFSVFEIFLYLLLLYIISGILAGRIFYIPYLSDLMNKIMKSYK